MKAAVKKCIKNKEKNVNKGKKQKTNRNSRIKKYIKDCKKNVTIASKTIQSRFKNRCKILVTLTLTVRKRKNKTIAINESEQKALTEKTFLI